MYELLITLGASILSPLAVSFIKQYNKTDYIHWIILAIIMYISLVYLYTHMLKTNNMSIIYAYLNLLNIIYVTLISIFYFEEELTTKQLVGLFVASIAIYLLYH